MAGKVNIDYLSNAKLNFKYFSSKEDLIEKGNQAFDFIKDKNPKLGRYKGSELTDQDDTITQYENKKVLDNVLTKFDDLVANVDMGGFFKKTRLKVTDDKRGIFDFGLASKGLYKPQEYFSQLLANDNPDEFADNEYGNKLSGIVPFDFVKEEIVFNEKQFWYTSFNSGKKYLLTKQDEGTRAIQLKIPGAKLVYKTNVRKAYIMHEKKGGKAKMVDIYIPVNYAVTLYTALPVFLTAKILQKAGIMTRISIVRTFAENMKEFFMWSYPVKDYGDELDFNKLALNGVDRRWWEVIRNNVKNINNQERAIKYKADFPSLNDYDYTLTNGAGSMPESKKDFIDAFSRYRNWYIQEIEKGNIPPLQIDKKLIFSGVDTSLYSYTELDESKTLEQVNYMLDVVDFQFNKVENCCKRIYKRLVEEPLEKQFIDLQSKVKNGVLSNEGLNNNLIAARKTYTLEFKKYVQKILNDSYYYPDKGSYKEDDESARKLDEELDTKIEELSMFLESI